jgi:hypothetical protein
MKYYYCFVLIILFPGLQSLFAQSDSLILKNGNVIIGEIKNMDRGVLTIETDYSDSDFKIEWDGINEIHTVSSFLITLSDGRRYNGTIESILDSTAVKLLDPDEGTQTSEINDIVFLKSVDEGFWSRLYASIDLGFSHTKANNLRQVNLRSTLGYLAERWSADANINTVQSTQDEVEPTRRSDAGLNYRYYLPVDWYVPVDLTFLSNTEQKLDLRTNAKMGIGKYLIHTNRTYWGFVVGFSWVNENFSSEDPDRKSWEGYFGTELNMFDVGDLSLVTKAVAFPGITEAGRWRFDLGFDTKYDLPLDFYIRLGLTYNFDNQPVEDASQSDYVFQTSIGWEW